MFLINVVFLACYKIALLLRHNITYGINGGYMYRIGYPFWRFLAKRGVTLKVRINVMHDEEAGVFVATSPDLRGLVCEAHTFEQLVIEVKHGVNDLVICQLRTDTVPKCPIADLRLCAA